jgi:hypothetical protein
MPTLERKIVSQLQIAKTWSGDQEHAVGFVPCSRTWEQSSVPGLVTNGGEAKPADGGADTLDQMARHLKEATPHCDALSPL